MALALELSLRDSAGQSRRQQQPGLQQQSRQESPGFYPAAPPQRSYSSAPFFRYEECEEDDEDLQMALACSLSEMEAQRRNAAADMISGAGVKAGECGGGLKDQGFAENRLGRTVSNKPTENATVASESTNGRFWDGSDLPSPNSPVEESKCPSMDTIHKMTKKVSNCVVS